MKANELMIGDWVKSKDKPVKINVARLYGMVYHYDSNATEEVQPIPLTEEMLLKNGFVFEEIDESFSIWNNEGYNINLFKEINSNEFWLDGFFGSITFTHVHEIQHLLRMCGLKEIADNFKVD